MSKQWGWTRIAGVAAITLAIVVGAAGWWFWRSYSALMQLKPSASFSVENTPPAPDYGDPAMWAALPTSKDEADLVPQVPDLKDRQADAPADVFFIHPTSYTQPTWNDPIDSNSRAREGVERFVASDASAFNGCCRVYAPLYRQATFYAFLTDTDDGPRALELAYSDVKRAFETFIKKYNKGRPFIIASHSQGTLHAFRLLRDKIDSTPLRKRMIAAYVLGFSLPADRFKRDYPNLSVCNTPDATGCLITWETWAKGHSPNWNYYVWDNDRISRQSGAEAIDTICVNPLSWRADRVVAAPNLHDGAIVPPPLPSRDHFISGTKHSGMRYERLDAPHAVRTAAACSSRALHVQQLPDPPFRSMLVSGNYHQHDFTLFYMNIRENAQRRVRAWIVKNETAPDPSSEAAAAGVGSDADD